MLVVSVMFPSLVGRFLLNPVARPLHIHCSAATGPRSFPKETPPLPGSLPSLSTLLIPVQIRLSR